MGWDEELDAAVGTLWTPEPHETWRFGDGLYLVVGTNKWDNELKVLDLQTGAVKLAAYDPYQRPRDIDYKIIYYPFEQYGFCNLHPVKS